jgi:predicted tellurium resistance membrane protein TerC
MEIVLGIDNIIFISIMAGRLPLAEQAKGRRVGLVAAAVSRLGLLLSVAWIVKLKEPLLSMFGISYTGKALVLLFGGIFLLYKATKEIHAKVEGSHEDAEAGGAGLSFSSLVVQVMLLDIVFALDSVITAVGMTEHISIMVVANIAALAVMLIFADTIARFIDQHPAIKMLALSFLLMIGLLLVSEGLGAHIPKGYVYGAMVFSVFVEALNIRAGTRHGAKPVKLHEVPRESSTP